MQEAIRAMRESGRVFLFNQVPTDDGWAFLSGRNGDFWMLIFQSTDSFDAAMQKITDGIKGLELMDKYREAA